MRDMRKEIIEKNKALVQQERERKVQDAMRIVEKKEEREAANRSLRDAMYTSRYADANKTAVMSQPLEEAAAAAGLAEVVPVPSPYRLS
jgi:capsular polysaccharide biosynthesis protein